MEKIKETLENVKNFIIFAYILLIIFVTICLLSYNDYKMTVFGKNTLIPIIDENLEPDYTIGDLVVVQKNRLSSVEAGDKIFFYRTASGETTINYATVLKSERVTDTEFTYTVEGDYKFSSSNFIGKTDTATVIPFVGKILSTLQSKWGFLFLGVFPSLVAFLTTLHYIIVEVQEEKERRELEAEKAKKKKKKKAQAEKVEKENAVEEVKEEKIVEEIEVVKNETINEEISEDTSVEKKEPVVTEDEEEIEEVVEVTVEVQKEEVKPEPVVEASVKVEEKTVENKNEEMTAEQKKKAMIEAKMKSMTEEEKRALIEAKLKAMSPEEKRALIEAKKRKMEADKK